MAAKKTTKSKAKKAPAKKAPAKKAATGPSNAQLAARITKLEAAVQELQEAVGPQGTEVT